MENVAVEFRASNILIRIEPNCFDSTFENVRNDVDLKYKNVKNIKMMS